MPFYEFEKKRSVVNSRAFVHREAVLIGDVRVDETCYVGAGVVLRGDSVLFELEKAATCRKNACSIHSPKPL